MNLPSQTVNVTGDVYRLANPVINTTSPITLAARVGTTRAPTGCDQHQQQLTGDQFTEGLNVTRGSTPSGFSWASASPILAAQGTSTRDPGRASTPTQPGHVGGTQSAGSSPPTGHDHRQQDDLAPRQWRHHPPLRQRLHAGCGAADQQHAGQFRHRARRRRRAIGAGMTVKNDAALTARTTRCRWAVRRPPARRSAAAAGFVNPRRAAVRFDQSQRQHEHRHCRRLQRPRRRSAPRVMTASSPTWRSPTSTSR